MANLDDAQDFKKNKVQRESKPHHMWQWFFLGLDVRKPVFEVSDKPRFKPVSSATENSKKIEILLVASLDMILCKKGIIKALISLRGCAG